MLVCCFIWFVCVLRGFLVVFLKGFLRGFKFFFFFPGLFFIVCLFSVFLLRALPNRGPSFTVFLVLFVCFL